VRLIGQTQQRRIRVGSHGVLHNVGDRARRHGRQPHKPAILAFQRSQRLANGRSAGAGSRCQHPQHRQQGGVIGPVDVLEKDRQRYSGRGRMYGSLQIAHHPVAQIGRRAQATQRLRITDRGNGAQGRHEQREKRNRLLILERLAE
jgi:hypothetical protein